MNCKGCKWCKWLCYYDGYFCGNNNSKLHDPAFIKDIETEVCLEHDERKGKFWLSEDGEF